MLLLPVTQALQSPFNWRRYDNNKNYSIDWKTIIANGNVCLTETIISTEKRAVDLAAKNLEHCMQTVHIIITFYIFDD